MNYDYKADLTTLISTYLIPLLVGYGFSTETSNAIVGVIVAIIIIGCNMLNERYVSKHLSQENDDIAEYLSEDDDSLVIDYEDTA